MRKFQYKVIYFFSFLKQAPKPSIKETIDTAYLRKKELQELNSILFESKDQPNYLEIQQMIKEALPPIKSVTKFTDLKNYSRIAYKLDLKKDEQIIQQLFTLILQDSLGNFILKDKLIHHIIDSVKLKKLDEKTEQLIEQLNLKDSILQKQYIKKFVDMLKAKMNPNQQIKQQDMSNKTQMLLQLVNNKQLRQNHQILQEQFSDPTLQEILILLPQIQNIPNNLRHKCVDKLKEYLLSIKVEKKQEGKVLSELNQLIYKNTEFFKKNQLPFSHVLEQLTIPELLESQINQILYIVMNSLSTEYFKKYENQIIEYINSKKSINMQQMVSYFVHLSQIYRILGNFPQQLLDQICQYMITNISKSDSNQLFLIIKALRLCQPTEIVQSLNKLIENKVEKGALNSNPDVLLNVVANKIKKSQVLFMPEIANTVQITQRNFGEWCHLIFQISELRELDKEVVEKFKKYHHLYRDSIGQNQFFYYFGAQFACQVDDINYLCEKIKQIKPFQLIRILYHINQFGSDTYQKLATNIITIIKENEKYLYSEFKLLDKGLLSFSLLSASLMNDQSFYNYLMKTYRNEIEKLVNEYIESDKQFSREKIIGASTVNQVTNQGLIQFYQSLKYHECLTGEQSNYYQKLESVIQKYKETQQDMPSYKEDTIESYLKQWNIKYIKDYNEILPFRIDFYLPQHNLGIECNGVSHYYFGKLRRSDELKYKFMQSKQIKIEVIESHSINVEQRLSELNIKQ